MTIIIFADQGGVCRSIRGNCIQPVIGGASGGDVERISNSSVYTAVMEVYELCSSH